VGELALRVLRRIDSGGVFEFCGFFYIFELFLALLCHFDLVCRFSCLMSALRLFLILDDLLEFFVGFWSSRCAL
jgi:hypothetical protein